MKITINVDCTPEEARRYMGLPDVAAIQEEMLREMQQRMMDNIKSMQSGDLMKAWMPMGIDSWLEFQKSFWRQMTSVAAKRDDKS